MATNISKYVQINDFILVNTHLQATYNLTKNNFEESHQQLDLIYEDVKKP